MYKHTYEGRKTHSRGESVSFGKRLLTLPGLNGGACVYNCVCFYLCVCAYGCRSSKCKHKLQLIALNYPVFPTRQPVSHPAVTCFSYCDEKLIWRPQRLALQIIIQGHTQNTHITAAQLPYVYIQKAHKHVIHNTHISLHKHTQECSFMAYIHSQKNSLMVPTKARFWCRSDTATHKHTHHKHTTLRSLSVLPHRTLEKAPSWFPTVLCMVEGTTHKQTNRNMSLYMKVTNDKISK